jgi:hypothetical protein
MQQTLKGYSWFMIMCSWEPDEDDIAVKRFEEVYTYLKVLNADQELEKLKASKPDEPRLDVDPDSFKAINLIGRRQFVMLGQAKSNRLQQHLALMIGLRSRIRVDVFPATLVHDLQKVMPT